MEKIITILSKQPLCRSQSEQTILYKTFSTYTFFQDLQASDESGGTFKDCVSSLAIETYSSSVALPSAVYITLKGTLSFNPDDLEIFQRSLKKHTAKHVGKGKNIKTLENLNFEVGSIFGELGKTKSYNVIIKEICCFAVLHNSVYEEILERQQGLLLEKIELLNKIEIFRNWSKNAINSAARAFDKVYYRKGEIVYSENDFPESVYIVISGEFKLSQSFVSLDLTDDNYEFGNRSFLKGKKLRANSKKSELQIMIKEKGDVFGYNEILEQKEKRDFSCICHSKHGELLMITEKEFSKKFSHPEILRVLEEQNSLIQKWTSRRLLSLKKTERFKAELSHTPKSFFKVIRSESNKSRNIVREAFLTPFPKLPQIFMNILYTKDRKQDRSFKFFRTELP